MSSRLPQTQSLPWTSRSTSTANRSEFDTVYAYRHSNHPSADQYFWQILPRYSRIPDHSAGQLWGSKVRKQHKADKQKSRESRQAPDFTAFRSSDPCILVREKGLEPLHLSALEPKSSASTNSATLAKGRPYTSARTSRKHTVSRQGYMNRLFADKPAVTRPELVARATVC